MPNADVLHDIPKEGERLSGLTRQFVYRLLQEGKLEGVKIGARTYITDRSLRQLPDQLTKFVPGTNPASLRATEGRRRKVAEAA